jgi:hypothetical protein
VLETVSGALLETVSGALSGTVSGALSGTVSGALLGTVSGALLGIVSQTVSDGAWKEDENVPWAEYEGMVLLALAQAHRPPRDLRKG